MYLALFVRAHKGGHSARIVSNTIKKRMADEYPTLPITDYVWTVVSDTTSSARNVAQDFEDSTQIDCNMHSANLGLKYALGISDNCRWVDSCANCRHTRCRWRTVHGSHHCHFKDASTGEVFWHARQKNKAEGLS